MLKNDLVYIHMWSEVWELFNDFKFVLAMNDDFLVNFCHYFKFPTTHNIQRILNLWFLWTCVFSFCFYQFCSVTKLASLPPHRFWLNWWQFCTGLFKSIAGRQTYGNTHCKINKYVGWNFWLLVFEREKRRGQIFRQNFESVSPFA